LDIGCGGYGLAIMLGFVYQTNPADIYKRARRIGCESFGSYVIIRTAKGLLLNVRHHSGGVTLDDAPHPCDIGIASSPTTNKQDSHFLQKT
jgi:hypothetical protein